MKPIPTPAPTPGQRPPRPQFWFTFKDVPPGKYVLTAKGTEKTTDGRVRVKLVQLDPLPFEIKASDKGTVTLDKPLKLTTDRSSTLGGVMQPTPDGPQSVGQRRAVAVDDPRGHFGADVVPVAAADSFTGRRIG